MTAPSGSPVRAEVKVGSRVGLHARPAAIVAGCAAEFQAAVRIAKGDAVPVDARSPLLIISLGAECGDVVTIEADGPDAADAIGRIGALVERDLDAEDEDAA
jgi:phosphotransferase system HPr (HPr) family protein